ncbi:polycomb group protein EMBRYONIC FLOWER 2-like isoform X3 [Phalaenopsis equestris]|uniref:polycomb group protein EMBRYONIC FLOWER 2-like isoform X3 n=1 Tax=Phalaenopsis equestris TaxID=78828 RepID=UPI0009E62FFD|nr:polycomb group protein EMBRYONIC FLOWER 2-like isoform X3 [Phalaenopsis equestris]
MPGLPFVDHDAAAIGCSCSRSRTAEQMCRQQSRVCLTAAEELAAEESLSIYCKPVEFYNILQRRAIRKPSFLQRCLQYKIQAKHKRRIKVIISLPGNMNSEQQQRNLFPLYVILVRPIANITIGEHAAVYGVCRSHILSSFYEYGKKETEATFVIPEIKKLSTARGASLNMVIVSIGEAQGSSDENHLPEGGECLASFPAKLEGNCFWGKVPIESLYSSLEKCVTLSLGHRSEMISAIDMHPSSLKSSFLDQHNCLNFKNHNIDSLSSYKIQVSLCAQEVGARERSPYDSYTYNDVPASTLPHIIRLRSGNVLFNYRYYNNKLQKTEVTEDFSCPFCLVQCSSFMGLRYHLCTCHDLFNFEFWVTEEYQAVNVSVRTDISRSEALLDGVDPRLQTFSYCSKFRRRKRLKNLAKNVNHVHPQVLELDSPEGAMEGSDDGYLQKGMDLSSSCRPISYPGVAELPNGFSASDGSSYKLDEKVEKSLYGDAQLLSTRQKSESYGSENQHVVECIERMTSSPDTATFCVATAQASTSNDCAHLLSGSNLLPSTMLQFAKTRRLSVERADPRSRALLTKRQFFHSHRAQPMSLEQVFSDHDSEDEVDDDIADFEDRRMLDDFVDVTKDEKHIMHLWNSFVRKQRVLADGHIPWACEAFTQLHGQDFIQAPALLWCWRLFMIKLWNHSLLDSRTMNNCNIILEKHRKESSDIKPN